MLYLSWCPIYHLTRPWFSKKSGGPVIDMGPYYLTTLVSLLFKNFQSIEMVKKLEL